MSTPREEYIRRRARWEQIMAVGERHHLLVSNARLAMAAAGAVIIWLVFISARLPPIVLAAPLVGFLALIVVHARVLQRNERAQRAARLYQRGLDRLDDRWAGAGPDGARFEGDHRYARDLDIFGPGSLFQLLDTARTEAGEERLAGWLKEPAPIDEIAGRQAAVAELAPRVDFREDLAVLAAEAQVGRTTALAGWAAAAPAALTAVVALPLAACVLVTIALIAAGFAGRLTAGPVLLWLGVQYGVALIWRRQVHEVLGRIDLPAYELKLLGGLFGRLEVEQFEGMRLRELHDVITRGSDPRRGSDPMPPSRRIAQLQRWVSVMDAMHNMLFAPIGHVLLVPHFAAIGINRWHAAHGKALTAWLEAVGEFEALASLATFAYEHPVYPFPVVVARGSDPIGGSDPVRGSDPVLNADELAHPLLGDSAVPNSIRLGGPGPHVIVVSGSNMSGKSTLLRALGVNVVLALAGAPVRARSLTLSPLAIGATLRVEDSLQAGHSRFYTEILRLRSVVDSARGPLPVLFLLDEILHGTNSHDRRIGAEAIVRALLTLGAVGLVTTHDLALTELVPALGGKGANVHFEDRLEDGKMLFDYRMREGVVERSNALALMRAVGLDV